MQDTDDLELLRQYVEKQSDAAFETLVKRHVNLVYSAALRSVESAQEAEEITQAVFVILARKAQSLRKETILSGWLYQTARLTAANFRRGEIRRARREKEAHMQSLVNEPESNPWPQVAPLLDQAMGGLNKEDRNAIVLRFFENKRLSEVGHAFGTTEDAAKMRVSRALEKLRKFFTKRGITLSTAVLAEAVLAHSVQTAPLELAHHCCCGSNQRFCRRSSHINSRERNFETYGMDKSKDGNRGWCGRAAPRWNYWHSRVQKMGSATGAYRDSMAALGDANTDPEAWRNPTNDFAAVQNAAPQVKILPSKFQSAQNLKGSPDGLKWVGIGVPVRVIAWVAYDCRPARVVFDTPRPSENYDFITSLPQGSLERCNRN
jgi:RNA polymerase sigma factor (sigma-70 family)